MISIKRIEAAILAASLMVVSAAGCSGSGKLRVATNAEFLPWEGLTEDGEYIGFDMDLIRLIGEKIDMKVEVSNMEFNGVVASLPSGTCDVAISGLTITPKRQQTVDFSESYHETAQILIVRQDDTVFTGTDKKQLDEQLKNKKIGVCERCV